MRFTRPVSREVDIDGQTFVLSVGEDGVEFRLKGKRKTARAAWSSVLRIAEGEDGQTLATFSVSRRIDLVRLRKRLHP